MKEKLWIILLFIILSAVLFWPVFLGKVNLNGNLLVSFYAPYGQNLPYKDSGWDQLRIYFPFLKVTQEALRSFQFPLWNPYAFSGHPHMADFQTGVFYPLNFIGIFFSQITFWHLLRISPTILAALFTFLYLKNLKLSFLSSFFGAIVFGFSPFILTWGEEVVMSPHSIVWLPLILFSVDRFLESKKKIFLGIISLATAFSFLAGYMQTSIYMFIFVFAYLLLRVNWKKMFFDRWFWRLAFAFILGAGIAAIQLAPSGELYFASARASITLRETLFNWLLPPQTVLSFLAPDIFGHPATHNFFREGAQYYEGIVFIGIATLIFALFSLTSLKIQAQKTFIYFLLAVCLVSLSLAFDLPSSKLFLSLPIPFLSTSIPNRILFISAFCLAVLGAIGLNRWLLANDRKIFKPVFVIAGFYILLAVYLLLARGGIVPYFKSPNFGSQVAANISLRNLAVPIGVFALSAGVLIAGSLKILPKKLCVLFVIVITGVHIFYFSQKYFSFSDRSTVFPDNRVLEFVRDNQGVFRTWSLGRPAFATNFASQYRIFFPEGYDSLNNRAYSEFTYVMQGNSPNDYVARADAGLGGEGSANELLSNEKRRRLIDLVGVKYVIVKREDFESMDKFNFKEVLRDEKFGVFENQTVMPRVFLAGSWQGPPAYYEENLTGQEIDQIRRKLIISKLLDSDFDFRNVPILEKPSPISPQAGEWSAEIVSYKPQEVVIKTRSEQPKLLFITDNWYPGWKAKVDGDETEILRADYTFRAVPLTGGEHIVRFYMNSNTFKIGLAISVLSLSLGTILLLTKNKILDK